MLYRLPALLLSALLVLLALAVAPAAQSQALPYGTERPDARELLLLQAMEPDRGPQDLFGAREAHVLPVLSRSDGRLEALLLLDAPSSTINPLDRLLAPRPRLGAAARVRTGSASVESALMLDQGPALALLCNETIGLATTLATLSEHCLLAPMDAGAMAFGRGSMGPGAGSGLGSLRAGAGWASAPGFQRLPGTARSATLQAGWNDRVLGVDLTFGLSWLDSGRLQPWSGGQDVSDALGLGLGEGLGEGLVLGGLALAAPELAGARLLSQGFGIRGLFDLGSQRWLSLGGSVSSNRLQSGLLTAEALRRWDSSALSVGVGQGNLYGELTGHVADLPGSDVFWGGLDLGISWRTPWDARLTVGAQNLISSGTNPWLQSDDGEALEEGASRVPYVRYQQDL